MFDSWGLTEWLIALLAFALCGRSAFVCGQLNGLELAGILSDDAKPKEQKRILKALKAHRRNSR